MKRCVALLALTCATSPSFAAQQEGVEFFEKKIRPLLAERCYSCHSARAEKLKGGLRLDTRAGLLKGGDEGPVIVPGDPGRSRLIRAIRHGDPDLKMPPKEKLSEAQIADLEAWVRSGAPTPADEVPEKRTELSRARGHWSFQPVKAPPLPPVRKKDWPRNPIDHFILARLEKKGLEPSPAADKRTLLRRTTFDVTGLPPTAEEMADFLADDSPDAFAKVVDRLLASPHYGERWGRHWLDVARYSDTKGYVQRPEDRRFVQAPAYRDWVVRAFNEDLPYDQFILHQLAADKIGGATDSLAAMGFLTVGRRFKNMIHDIIDDRIDVVTRGLMGLTVGCARCHDHKFDPIPTRDYYSLYGIFAGTLERTVPLGPASDRAYEETLGKRVKAFQSAFKRISSQLEERHRRLVSKYLAMIIDPRRLPAEEVFVVFGPDEPNPACARRWIDYLSKTKQEFHPIFALWHALMDLPEEDWPREASAVLSQLLSDRRLNRRVAEAFSGEVPASKLEIAERYGSLLAEAKGRDPDQEALRNVLYGEDSPVKLPPGGLFEIEYFLDGKMRQELMLLQAAIDRWILESDGAPPHAVILQDRADLRNPRVFRRGNPANLGEEVPRQFLSSLSEDGPHPFTEGSGRLELARAIIRRENPLTARVMVNRIWLHHFGAGLVRSPSDFGLKSDPPTHPELLDYLARSFMDQGWSVKALHRLILLSSTWRQDSADSDRALRIDPENTLLWRVSRRRLDFESMRDALLAVSGQLDPAIGGRAEDLTSQPFSRRRTLYGLVDRLNLASLFGVFDFPNPDVHSPQRYITSATPQALFLMNSPFVQEQARRLSNQSELVSGSTEERIRRLYRRVYGRPPTPVEIEWGSRFVERRFPARPAPATSPWQYGFGGSDRFTPLARFTGNIWHDGPPNVLISRSAQYPDVRTGWASLSATSGHPGHDLQHAVIRRWVAPRAGTVEIRGTVTHVPDGESPSDGIRARIVSSRAGPLASEILKRADKKMELQGVVVEAGESIDFVVDGIANPDNDMFNWTPVVRMEGRSWDAAREFRGPSSPPLTPWERYAQALLESNEFIFVD